MRVGLILAPFDQVKADGFQAEGIKPYGYSLPLGIAYLAAQLEAAGHHACVLDPSPMGLTTEQILNWIEQQQLDVLGVSTMTHTSTQAYALIQQVKCRFQQLPILLGGSHCNVFPDLVLQECPDIDIVVIGEAESRIVAICEAVVLQPRNLATIPGLIIQNRTTATPLQTPPPCDETQLDSVPFPARHLFDHSLYTPYPDQIKALPVTSFMSSRGCTWKKCKFCFEGGEFMPAFRRRSPENVVAELKQVIAQGFKGVAIWDDNFTAQPGWIRRFVGLMKAQQLRIHFTCFGRVNTLTREMAQTLKEVGCFSIYFGFESGSQEILDAVAKGTSLDQARRAVQICHDAGIQVRGSFILGMPDDTPKLATQTIAFARELDLDSVKFMLYTPEPGTELFEAARRKGTLVASGFQGSLSQACYVPDGYDSREQLESIARRANRDYLLRPAFIWKKLLTIRSWADIKKYWDGLRMVMSLR